MSRPALFSSWNIRNWSYVSHSSAKTRRLDSLAIRTASSQTRKSSATVHAPKIPYTREEDDLIVQRKLEGAPLIDIAHELGRVPQSVGKRYRLHIFFERPNLPPPQFRKQDKDLEAIIKQRVEAGDSLLSIARSLGITQAVAEYRYHRVFGRVKETKFKPWSEDEVSRIRELRKEGVRWNAIAEELGRPVGTARSKFHSMKATKRKTPLRRQRQRRRVTEAEKTRWRELFEQGNAPNDIAAMFDRAPALVRDVVGRAPNRKAFSAEELDLLKKLRVDEELGWKEVADKIPGRSPSSCQTAYSYYSRKGRWPELRKKP